EQRIESNGKDRLSQIGSDKNKKIRPYSRHRLWVGDGEPAHLFGRFPVFKNDKKSGQKRNYHSGFGRKKERCNLERLSGRSDHERNHPFGFSRHRYGYGNSNDGEG